MQFHRFAADKSRLAYLAIWGGALPPFKTSCSRDWSRVIEREKLTDRSTRWKALHLNSNSEREWRIRRPNASSSARYEFRGQIRIPRPNANGEFGAATESNWLGASLQFGTHSNRLVGAKCRSARIRPNGPECYLPANFRTIAHHCRNWSPQNWFLSIKNSLRSIGIASNFPQGEGKGEVWAGVPQLLRNIGTGTVMVLWVFPTGTLVYPVLIPQKPLWIL